MGEEASRLAKHLQGVDHLAIALNDLEAAVKFYTEQLGFTAVERRSTSGRNTAMESAVLAGGPVKVVLLQGTSPESQVTRYVQQYGPGVQHVAFLVQDMEAVVADLQGRGVAFDTGIIAAPGLEQAFTRRHPISGMMYELIERTGEEGFSDDNVKRLFESLEQKDAF